MDIDDILIVIILILLFINFGKPCNVINKIKKDKYCPYPGPQRFDPYNPVDLGRLGSEACCGRRDTFGAGGCCGSCGKCLPTYAGCPPGNQIYAGKSYWIDYSRLIGNDMAWRILDENQWPMTYDQAVAQIPIGSVLCWNSQPMARIAGIAQHVNMPDSSFIILDQSFKINLAGQRVTITPS
jgi:hypothetical protein